ncbi:unnamed protein product [Callosobruchus maculatus]|nr:unnamed protein product [Callosobruchus maculatus]
MLPKFEELSQDFPDVVLLKVDVDENEELAREYNVAAMPTFVYIKKNVILATFSGANPDRLKKLTQEHLLGLQRHLN